MKKILLLSLISMASGAMATTEHFESSSQEVIVKDENGIVSASKSSKKEEATKDGKVVKSESSEKSNAEIEWKTSKFEDNDFHYMKEIISEFATKGSDFELDVEGNKNANDKVIEKLISEEMLLSITKLVLKNSGVTVQGLRQIAALKAAGKLKEVDASGIFMTDEEAAELKRAFENLHINLVCHS